MPQRQNEKSSDFARGEERGAGGRPERGERGMVVAIRLYLVGTRWDRDAGYDSPAMRELERRKTLSQSIREPQRTVRASSTERKVMYLQEYVKYLICMIIVQSAVQQIGFHSAEAKENGTRKARGVLDILFGRFRSCGGCVCGKSNRSAGRLLGGEYTESHEFPWLTNIHVKSKTLVSGVLINDRYVITAASQLVGATAPEIKVSLGEYDRCNLDVSSLNTSVETVTTYPEFNSDSHAHDLALLRLSRPVKFEKRISPVCLPNPGSTYLGQVGTLFGWTESKSADDIDTRTCRPRKLGLPILGYTECIKSGVDPANFHDDSGCIGIVGGNSIVCNNDVGSSLLYRSYTGIYDLVGVLSDTNICDDKPRTAVFTRVGPHLDWILQNTKDACYCTK